MTDPLYLLFCRGDPQHPPLNMDRLLDGACFIDPPAFDRPCRLDYILGQIGRVQGRDYRSTLTAAAAVDREVAKGWLTEDADTESAVQALIMQRGRGK